MIRVVRLLGPRFWAGVAGIALVVGAVAGVVTEWAGHQPKEAHSGRR